MSNMIIKEEPKYISLTGHCFDHCMNKTTACYSCEENYDCDCELIKK